MSNIEEKQQPVITPLNTSPSYIPIQFKLYAISKSETLATEILALINDIHVVNDKIATFKDFCETYKSDDIPNKTIVLTNRLIGEAHKYIKDYLAHIQSVADNGEITYGSITTTEILTYVTNTRSFVGKPIYDEIGKTVMKDFIYKNYGDFKVKNAQHNQMHFKDYVKSLLTFYGIKPPDRL